MDTHENTAEASQAASLGSLTAPMHQDREYKFSFKKQTVKDELGMDIKRPPVILTVPIPTFDGLLEALADTKVSSFVIDLVEEAIKDQVRSQLSDEDKPVNRQEDLDLTKLTLSYIANMPKSERTGGGISKEVWTDFEKDYVEVMVPIRKDEVRVSKAAALFTGRLAKCRTDKPVLNFLRKQLGTWAENTPNIEDYAEVYKFLDDKITEYLNKDNPDLLAAL